jgi:hypothetical protein
MRVQMAPMEFDVILLKSITLLVQGEAAEPHGSQKREEGCGM